MTRGQMWRAIGGVTVVAVVGCQSAPGPAAPDPAVSISGTWVGTAHDSAAGEGTVQWVITQTDSGVAGSFTNAFADPAFSTTGMLAGLVTGAAATVFLMPAEPIVCSPALSVTGTIYVSLAIGPGQLTGRYSTLTCSGGRAGTMVLSRE